MYYVLCNIYYVNIFSNLVINYFDNPKLTIMTGKELIARTKVFAINAIKLSEMLPVTFLGNHIKGQLIRCSTSVAANYRATRLSQSNPTFISKLSIVIEEADESDFWIDFALEFNLLEKQPAQTVMNEAKELTAIFIATRKTMNQKRNR